MFPDGRHKGLPIRVLEESSAHPWGDILVLRDDGIARAQKEEANHVAVGRFIYSPRGEDLATSSERLQVRSI